MTDKEIIIGGVVVSECEELANYDNVLFVCHKTGKKCNINKNCYYKQLKRLEQENARIIEDNGKLFDKAIETRKENVALQDTLFSYRQILSKIKAIAETGMDKYHNGLIGAKPILDLITKAEEE